LITDSPLSQVVCLGSALTLNVAATSTLAPSYQWRKGGIDIPGALSATFNIQSVSNSDAGLYDVVVSNTCGSVLSNPANVTVNTPPVLVSTQTNLNCFGGNTGAIDLSVTGGTPPYTYSWSNSAITKDISGLIAGSYSIVVTDRYNCSAQAVTVVIKEPTEVKASLALSRSQTCLTLSEVTLTATGGIPPYSYSTDNTTYSTVLFSSSISFDVPVGTYNYYVKDANGCVAYKSNDIKIDPLPPLLINLTNTVINCKGDNSGNIIAEAQGGLGNYFYSLLNGAGRNIFPNPVQLRPGYFTGLFAGNYIVKVTSEDCTTTATVTISEPLYQLTEVHTTKNVSCNGAKNGEITINASGGTGLIQYAISPNLNQFKNTNTFINLTTGNYDVIIQDQVGCFVEINFDITEPSSLKASTVPMSVIPEICAGDKDGAFSLSISSGTAPYRVSLDNPTGTYTTGTVAQAEFDFTGLSGGNHIVYIRDAADCYLDWSVLLPESINMNPVAVVKYDCVSNTGANLVTINLNSSTINLADVDYSLDGGTYQTSNIIKNVPVGTHFVTTRHTMVANDKH
jgi:hypothetical protein